jgi:glutamate synthase (NADPH/NADH) small chain
MDGVFASGDVVTGARTVVEAVASAKQVAQTIDDYIKSQEN